MTRGRKLRVDSAVVATAIHYPVDSTLLGDGVRVLNHALQCARRLVQPESDRARATFRDRTRSVRHVMRRLITTSRQRGEQVPAQLQEDYERLIGLTERVVQQAREVRAMLSTGDRASQHVVEQFETFIPRVERVITQARRRVLEGRPLPAPEKLVSIFEPHTAIIRKGKLGHPVEFGRVLWLDETEGGIISRYAVLSGNPDDAHQVVPSLEHHIDRFGRAPRLLAGDRKVYSPKGERSARERGVQQVVLPHAGRRSPERRVYEQQRWFQRGRRWRAGIEGRISVLNRRHKLARCLYHGSDGMERWIGWGIITHNLQKIASVAR